MQEKSNIVYKNIYNKKMLTKKYIRNIMKIYFDKREMDNMVGG